MKIVSASQFRQQISSLLGNLGNEGIVVAKRGKPVARLIPVGPSCARLIGSMKGKIQIKGDIMSTGLRWNAES